MRGEDKIFLLQAYYAVSGDKDMKKKFESSKRNTEMVVHITRSYTKEEVHEQFYKFMEMEKNEQI
jgi:hypothetical protein